MNNGTSMSLHMEVPPAPEYIRDRHHCHLTARDSLCLQQDPFQPSRLPHAAPNYIFFSLCGHGYRTEFATPMVSPCTTMQRDYQALPRYCAYDTCHRGSQSLDDCIRQCTSQKAIHRPTEIHQGDPATWRLLYIQLRKQFFFLGGGFLFFFWWVIHHYARK